MCHMCCLLSLCETCQTCVLRVQIWVWNLRFPPVLLLSSCIQGSQLNRLSQGTLPGGVASVLVEIQTVPVAVETIERIQKVYRSLYGTNFTLWPYLERCNVHLGTDADSRLRTWVLGEAPTFGDEWLECETRGRREHKIALLPHGRQVVPITELLCRMYSWRT